MGEQFSKEFSGGILKNLEKTVEDDYISNLRNNCWKEKQQSIGANKTNPISWVYCRLNLGGYTEIRLFGFFSLQRRECCTEHAILGTLTCTKEHRGLARRAAPNCLRSQPPSTAEAACINAGSPDNHIRRTTDTFPILKSFFLPLIVSRFAESFQHITGCK